MSLRLRWGALMLVALLAGGCGAQISGGAHRAARTSTHATTTAAAVVPATPTAPGSGRPGRLAAPVLMYHVIAAPPAGAPFPGLYVLPADFAAQMRALAHAGFHAVTLDQLMAYWRRGVPLPAGRPVVVTFDNGYRSQATEALPVLRALGWPADLNIQLTGLPPSQGGLTGAQVRAMLAAGWELDTQGLSHADLVTQTAAGLRAQIVAPRLTLQRRYHVAVNWFCYPSGHYDATVIAAVKAAGYVGSTTTIPGWGQPGEDPYRIKRLRVLGGTTPAALLAQIAASRETPPPPAAYPN